MTQATMTMVDKATHRWGDPAPDWVRELAALVDREGLKAAGKRVSYSPTTVSQVISRSYRGDVSKVEDRVRGALMGLTVDCPELGEISRTTCLDWQAKPWAPTSSHRVRMYHACRACPLSKFRKEKRDG